MPNPVEESVIAAIVADANTWQWHYTQSYMSIKTQLSPNQEWLLVYKYMREGRDDRYSNDIEFAEYHLCQLSTDRQSFTPVIRLFYYYTYNDYCQETEEIGSKVTWSNEGPATLHFYKDNKLMDLTKVTMEEIQACHQPLEAKA